MKTGWFSSHFRWVIFACIESLSRSSGDKIPFLPVKNRRINYEILFAQGEHIFVVGDYMFGVGEYIICVGEQNKIRLFFK